MYRAPPSAPGNIINHMVNCTSAILAQKVTDLMARLASKDGEIATFRGERLALGVVCKALVYTVNCITDQAENADLCADLIGLATSNDVICREVNAVQDNAREAEEAYQRACALALELESRTDAPFSLHGMSLGS